MKTLTSRALNDVATRAISGRWLPAVSNTWLRRARPSSVIRLPRLWVMNAKSSSSRREAKSGLSGVQICCVSGRPRVVKSAAERAEREVLVVRFSSEYCTDGGRRINSFEPDWPESLTGFAKRAYEFWQKELEPKRYKLRAQIMDFPGGMPGDVGIFLSW
jgi:hypothetical protein